MVSLDSEVRIDTNLIINGTHLSRHQVLWILRAAYQDSFDVNLGGFVDSMYIFTKNKIASKKSDAPKYKYNVGFHSQVWYGVTYQTPSGATKKDFERDGKTGCLKITARSAQTNGQTNAK